MNRGTCRVLAAVAAVTLVGCVPEKKIVWSPDGKYAAVIGADGLYRCDADGKLSPRLAENVSCAAWFPDSRSLAIVSTHSMKTWDELAAILSKPRKEAIIQSAEQVRTALLAYGGEWEKFHPEVLDRATAAEITAGLLYLRDKHSEGLAEKLGKKWDELKSAEAAVTTLAVIDGTKDGPPPSMRMLRRELPGIMSVSVSPDGKAAAYVQELPGENAGGRLMIVSTDTPTVEPLLAAERVGRCVTWSPDGRSVAFMRASVPLPNDGSFALRLGSVSRRQVRGKDGKLFEGEHGEVAMHIGKPDSALDKANIGTTPATHDILPIEDLAGIVYVEELNVQWLRDGRIVFASMDVRMPCTAKDMPNQLGLFMLDTERMATVVRLLPREAETRVGDAVNYFEVSPDSKRVAIPGKNGMVTVLTLASGEVTSVQGEKDAEDKLRTLPTWRTADELCFAAPAGSKDGSPKRAEIVLWSTKGTRAISRAWTELVVSGVLTAEKKGEAEKKSEGKASSQPSK